MPGRLREAVGASYAEYTNLTTPCADGRPASTSAGRRRDGMGGRARARGRGHPGGLRAPAPRSLGGGDHARARPRARDLRRHAAHRSFAVALARWLRPAPDAWDDRPESVTVTSARNQEGDGSASCRTGRGNRRAWRCPWRCETCCPRQTSPRRGSGSGGMGYPGALGEAPGRAQGGGRPLCGTRSAHRSAGGLLLPVVCAACWACSWPLVDGGDDGDEAAAVVRPRRSTWPPSSRSRPRSRSGRGRPAPRRR